MNIFGIALSGMQAAQAELNASASNVANLQTPGYQAQRVDLVDLSGSGGVAVSGITRSQAPAPVGPDGQRGSNVDLATETINITRAQLLYKANAAVIRIGIQTTGALLDILDGTRRDE